MYGKCRGIKDLRVLSSSVAVRAVGGIVVSVILTITVVLLFFNGLM